MTVPARHTVAATRTVTALALSGCLLAACSSSGSGGGSGAASSAPRGASASSASSASSATSSVSPQAGGSPVGAASSTGAVHGDSNSTFCATARQVQASESKQSAQLASGSPAEVKKYVERAEAELGVFQRLAPQQLKADVAVIVGTTHKLYAALKANGYDFRKVVSSPALRKQLDSPAEQAASQRVGTYMTQVCKIKTD